MISGTAKGHKLRTVKGNTTRPTSDRVKESLFNIIAEYIPDAKVLDLYSGTGNLGIEALSRGAKSCVFIDQSKECYSVIKENLNHTKLSDKASVFTGEVITAVKKLYADSKKFDIIFMDPPYNKNLVVETVKCIAENVIIHKEGIIIAERDYIDEVPEQIGQMKRIRDQKYGDTILSFYVPVKEDLG